MRKIMLAFCGEKKKGEGRRGGHLPEKDGQFNLTLSCGTKAAAFDAATNRQWSPTSTSRLP
ncbi:hypothetical protein [Parvibaculum sp.]|uniref:hypothetical protein n=1 Tax=Parvibaculum sp. TaxID=2024848 RepID=UPI002D807CF9|nr:hypothetical protein [Parvibaculum sp.]